MKKYHVIIGIVVGLLISIFYSSSYCAETKAKPPEKAESSKAGPSATSGPPLPDLIVERIWLDNQCRINFQLKNNGSGAIPDDKHRLGKVRLFIGSREVDYSLSQAFEGRQAIDPSGALKRSGGFVSFNTGERLETQRLVRVWVDNTEQIQESREDNNTGRESLTPSCIPPVSAQQRQGGQSGVAGPSAATMAEDVSGKPGTTAQSHVSMPLPSLAITSFYIHRCVPPGTMSMSVSKTDPPQQDWFTTDLGEPICLSWVIEGCRIGEVAARLATGTGSPFSTNPGTRTDLGQECFRISNQERITAIRSGVYTLTASGGAPRASASKSYELVVRRPVLKLLDPVIAEVSKDPATVRTFGRSYTLTFSVQNIGDLDFARHSIGIDCRFDYDSPVDLFEGEIIYRREHFSSSYQSDPVHIRKRQQVTLGDMRINIPVVLASEIGEPAWLPTLSRKVSRREV